MLTLFDERRYFSCAAAHARRRCLHQGTRHHRITGYRLLFRHVHITYKYIDYHVTAGYVEVLWYIIDEHYRSQLPGLSPFLTMSHTALPTAPPWQ